MQATWRPYFFAASRFFLFFSAAFDRADADSVDRPVVCIT